MIVGKSVSILLRRLRRAGYRAAAMNRPMEKALQIFQFLGAILGTASAAFIIYDRLVRSRPIFALHAKPGSSPSENYLYLRIVNELDEDLIVENFSIVPPILGLSEDHEVRSMVAAQLQEGRTLVLPPP